MTEPPTDAMLALIVHHADQAGLVVTMPTTKLEAIKLLQSMTLGRCDRE